ncbi:hypothetical protein ACNAN0_01270 [Agrilactobacillus fermenti]|uniref:hypothetical protein n=1 Tax=Agrilactobacillus fermenti TaxID=2586909 RepID=UPI003A5BD7AF
MKKSSIKYVGVALTALLAAAPVAVPILPTAVTATHVQAATAGLPETQVIVGWTDQAPLEVMGAKGLEQVQAPAAKNVHSQLVTRNGNEYLMTNAVAGKQYYIKLDGKGLPVAGTGVVNRVEQLQKNHDISGYALQATGDKNAKGDFAKLNSLTGEVDLDPSAAAQLNAAIDQNNGKVTPVAEYTYVASGSTVQTEYYGFLVDGQVYFIKKDALAAANIQLVQLPKAKPTNPVNPVMSSTTTVVLNVSGISGTITTTADSVAAFNNAALTSYAGIFLAKVTQLPVDQVATRDDGTVMAYHVAANADQAAGKWLAATNVTFAENTPAPQTSRQTLPADTVLYSQSAAKIYSDPALTQESRKKLALTIDEWRAFEKSLDEAGNVIAYRLGTNQWVKANALQSQKVKTGVFVASKGTPLYDVSGQVAGNITTTGTYRVYAERHLNGHQALKLGTDAQWIYAENGAYYPAQ